MLRKTDPLVVQLTPKDLSLAQDFARQAEVGGQSQVRGSDRQATLRMDQAVGQLGELALSRYVGGTVLFYELTRTIRNLDPLAGDGGGDLLATNVDVKCSAMRASTDPLKYRLLVRPKERHPDTVYLLALVAQDVWTTGLVWLVGWCREADLPAEPASDGPFQGAYVVPATQLHPLPPFSFNWFWNYSELTCRATG